MKENDIPTFDQLMNPLLQALRMLGGSGSIEEIYSKTVEVSTLSEEVLSQLHDPDRSSMTEIGYRLAWARTYLRKYEFLENSSRGIWTLTEKAKNVETVDPSEVVRYVRAIDRQERRSSKTPSKRSRA